MVKIRVYNRGNFAANLCPKKCPFRDKLGAVGTFYCSFAIYADQLEPGRRTRTEVGSDGTPNYHIPPNCDIYEKYKDKTKEIHKLKTQYDQYGLKRPPRKNEPDLFVTGPRHQPKVKHKGDF